MYAHVSVHITQLQHYQQLVIFLSSTPYPSLFLFLSWVILKPIQNLARVSFHLISPINTSECISTDKALKDIIVTPL